MSKSKSHILLLWIYNVKLGLPQFRNIRILSGKIVKQVSYSLSQGQTWLCLFLQLTRGAKNREQRRHGLLILDSTAVSEFVIIMITPCSSSLDPALDRTEVHWCLLCLHTSGGLLLSNLEAAAAPRTPPTADHPCGLHSVHTHLHPHTQTCTRTHMYIAHAYVCKLQMQTLNHAAYMHVR